MFGSVSTEAISTENQNKEQDCPLMSINTQAHDRDLLLMPKLHRNRSRLNSGQPIMVCIGVL